MKDLVIKLIKEAGKEVLNIYQKGWDTSFKKDGSPVTSADYRSEKILMNGLSKTGYDILSEETKGSIKTSRAWIIDPLDGTKDFIDKTGEFSIIVGLIEEGRPILGAVYHPVTDTLYFAEKGKGAYVGSKLLKVSKSQDTIVVSRNHFMISEINLINKLNKKPIKYGSVGLKIALVSSGVFDAYINLSDKTHQWDCCGADIILKEAGGKIADIEGNDLIYGTSNIYNLKGIIASNKLMHNEIIQNI